MKIYALKDTLIDYYMQPFVAPGDKEVFAAFATQVNGETASAISQAPHQFEVWRLGEVDEEGHIQAERVCLGNCARLIRTGLRTAEERKQGIRPLGGVEIESRGPAGGDRAAAGTNPAVTTNAPPATAGAVTEGGRGAR